MLIFFVLTRKMHDKLLVKEETCSFGCQGKEKMCLIAWGS